MPEEKIEIKEKDTVASPLKTLEDTFGTSYFKDGNVKFQFAHLDYEKIKGTNKSYKRAEEVVGYVKKKTLNPEEKSTREGIILDYGQIGFMERVIHNRQIHQRNAPGEKTEFDGGHLVLRSLFQNDKKKNADVEGNLAPQQNDFNRRWWRSIEAISTQLTKVTDLVYTVSVKYDNDTYQQDGEKLLEAGVIDSNDIKDNEKLQEIKDKKNISFNRWIPHTWYAVIKPQDSTTVLPQLSFNKSKIHDKEAATLGDAHDIVFNASGAPSLTTSQTTSAYIDGLAIDGADPNKFLLDPIDNTFTATAFTSIPEINHTPAEVVNWW